MPSKILGLHLATRVILATALLGSGAVILGNRLLPHVSIGTAILYTVAAACALLALLVCATIVSLTFRQFILRKGGTDAQWFWFSSEPNGLAQLRADAIAKPASL